MDVAQLKSLVAIARYGTLSRAAEVLHLSQPAVSAHVKALEEELEIALFDRHARGMSLTADGSAIHEHALKMLSAFDAIKQEAAQRLGNYSGALTIGTNDAVAEGLPRLMNRMQERAPALKLTLVQATSGAVARMVASGDLDAGFVEGDFNKSNLASEVITHAEFVIAYPSAWEDRIHHANPAGIFELPWIGTTEDCSFYRLTSALFASHGSVFAPVMQTDQESLLASLVKQGTGASLLRREHAENAVNSDLTILPEIGVKTAIHLVRSRQSVKSHLIALLQTMAHEVWRSGSEQDC